MQHPTSIYLDYNATTPVDPRVLEAMLPFFSETYGNPASITHHMGQKALKALKAARVTIAEIIGATAHEVTFTSGATESINLALKGVVEANTSSRNHIVTISTEHKAVIDTCRYLETKGTKVTWLPVEQDGLLGLEKLEKALSKDTLVVSVMFANNETGIIQPIQEIAGMARRYGALFFTDATQAVGKLGFDVEPTGIDLMAWSAHKLYGPKGIGALYVRSRNPKVTLAPQLHGGGHERTLRSGTLNMPGIIGFARAMEIAETERVGEARRLSALRDKLEAALLALGGVSVNGDPYQRLPHVSNLAFEGIESEALLLEMPELGLATGSACMATDLEPSHVLEAMGVSALQSVRVSLGRFTTEEEVERAIEVVSRGVRKLRRQ